MFPGKPLRCGEPHGIPRGHFPYDEVPRLGCGPHAGRYWPLRARWQLARHGAPSTNPENPAPPACKVSLSDRYLHKVALRGTTVGEGPGPVPIERLFRSDQQQGDGYHMITL